jgi:hypothetical protein
MTDTQLIVATLWTLFAILVLAAVYALEFISGRLEHILGRPLEKIEQRLSMLELPLREANRHRESLIARIVGLTQRL